MDHATVTNAHTAAEKLIQEYLNPENPARVFGRQGAAYKASGIYARLIADYALDGHSPPPILVEKYRYAETVYQTLAKLEIERI